MNTEILKDSTILIVDDNPENLDILISTLEKYSSDVRIATSGEKALELVSKFLPDIILLDVMMPGIDGFEVCSELKKHSQTKNIPVIFMTALTDTVDEVRGFELDAVDYITKPFKLEKVLARISAHLTIEYQKRELEELVATKNRFFSIISHDLKSPLNGLITILSAVDRIEQNKMMEYLHELKQRVNIIYKLLINLLDWSNLNQGRMEYKPGKYNIAEIVNEIIELYKTNANEKGITILNNIPGETYSVIDKNMITSVIRNLINNAIKFTPNDGEIKIDSIETEEKFLEISITDTGTGIKKSDLEYLFDIKKEKFTNIVSEHGSGLGLILCREFVEKNGGTIRVVSEEGKGSTFSFTVPTDE